MQPAAILGPVLMMTRRRLSFKSTFLNQFVLENNINSVIEWGCGDGAQLTLARYPLYTGIDISETIVEDCRKRFAVDKTKNVFQHKN